MAGARPNHQADRGSDPNHQGIWSPPRAGAAEEAHALATREEPGDDDPFIVLTETKFRL